MGFGQPTGPPASAKQVGELLALLLQAGHGDFRDARGPMGFTQRQAAGKFTRAEADAFIERLEAAGGGGGDDHDQASPSPRREPVTAAERRQAVQARSLRQIPPELLAGELPRRGWIVMAP